MKKFSLLLALAVALFSCKEKEEEPFSEKLSITYNYTDQSNIWQNQSTDLTINTISGKYVDFTYSIGGEEGFGSKDMLDVVASLEITREGASGTTTCVFVKLDELHDAANVAYIINEDMKLTFTLTSVDGEKSVVGPFDIKAKIMNEVKTSQGECNASNFFVPQSPNLAYPTTYNETVGSNGFMTTYPVLGYAQKNGKEYIISPSELTNYNAYTDLTAKFTCGWRTTKLMPYTGSLDIDEFNSGVTATNTFAAYDSLTISNPQMEIEIVPGARFIFETQEGKKGLGKFNTTQSGSSGLFFFECQL